MYVSIAALIVGWISLERIVMGGFGALVVPVVIPETTVGVAPPVSAAID